MPPKKESPPTKRGGAAAKKGAAVAEKKAAAEKKVSTTTSTASSSSDAAKYFAPASDAYPGLEDSPLGLTFDTLAGAYDGEPLHHLPPTRGSSRSRWPSGLRSTRGCGGVTILRRPSERRAEGR